MSHSALLRSRTELLSSLQIQELATTKNLESSRARKEDDRREKTWANSQPASCGKQKLICTVPTFPICTVPTFPMSNTTWHSAPYITSEVVAHFIRMADAAYLPKPLRSLFLAAPGTTRLPRVLAICSLSCPLLSGGLFSLWLRLPQPLFELGHPYSIALLLCFLSP
jgi:hypothetical protein